MITATKQPTYQNLYSDVQAITMAQKIIKAKGKIMIYKECIKHALISIDHPHWSWGKVVVDRYRHDVECYQRAIRRMQLMVQRYKNRIN